MSDLSNSYNDILIDYCEELLKFSDYSGTSNNYHVYSPVSGGVSHILLDNSDFDNSKFSTVQQVNKNLLSNLNLVGLTKEDIYKLITELSVEDISFFSPSIEIYRKLPLFATDTQDIKQIKKDNFVYKKMDFVDGYHSYNSSSVEKQIFEGTMGTGFAAISDASWEIVASGDALDGKTELIDMFLKVPTTIPKFDISFVFDSAQTFFGNDSDLIANFFMNPIAHINKLKTKNIESDDVTRNYAYLMFFNDIQTDVPNNTNEIGPTTNKDAYRFFISIGYKPTQADFDIIITDPVKKERLKKFNNFLLNYGEYFNLYFRANLGGYDFEFGKDNSIKLKCKFTGIVDQSSLRDLFSLRHSDMDFMNVLKDIGSRSSVPLSSGSIDSTEAGKVLQTITALKKYMISCNDKEKLDKAKEYLTQAQAMYSEYEQAILQYANSYSNFILNGVKINQIIIEDESDANVGLDVWYNTVDKPYSAIFKKDLMRNIFTSDSSLASISTFTWADNDAASGNATGLDNKYDTNNNDWFSTIDLSVSFFFFGDLINNIIDKFIQYHYTLDANQTKYTNDNIKVILPNLNIKRRVVSEQAGFYNSMDGANPIHLKLNAAYMPIPMDVWFEWTQKYLKNRTYYHLGDLLNDLKVLLNYSMNYKNSQIIESNPLLKTLSNKYGTFYNYSTFYQTTFTIDSDPKNFLKKNVERLSGINDSYFETLQIPAFNSNNIHKPNIINGSQPPIEYHIFGYTFDTMQIEDSALIYNSKADGAGQKDSYITSAGDIKKDMSLGIVHFFIGNQMGLAKSFKFSAGTTPYGIEVQIDSSQDSSPIGIKNININDVEIKVVGGNFFKPLETIYVHPHYTFGDPFDSRFTVSNVLNIGGYYSIMKVNGSFSSKGVYETTITAKFLYPAQRANKTGCNERPPEEAEGVDAGIMDKIKGRTSAERRLENQAVIESDPTH